MATSDATSRKRKRKAETNTPVPAPKSAFEIAKAWRQAASRPEPELPAPRSQEIVEEIISLAIPSTPIVEEVIEVPIAASYNSSPSQRNQESLSETGEEVLLEAAEPLYDSEQSDASADYGGLEEDSLEYPRSYKSASDIATQRLQRGYIAVPRAVNSPQNIELTIDRDKPLLLDRPCLMTIVSGVVRVFGALFDRKSDPVSIFPTMTHYRIPIETNEEAVVALDFSGYGEDSASHCRASYFSEYNLLRTGAENIPVLEIPALWVEARREYLIEWIARDSRSRTVHICGRHSRTRSLFFKYMLNSLFSRGLSTHSKLARDVYVLDFDAESPEFTTAGQVSLIRVHQALLGPAYMNLAYPPESFSVIRAHAISLGGHRSYRQTFMAMARDLRSVIDRILYECHMQNRTKPVVIIRHGHYKEPLLNSDFAELISIQEQASLIYVVDKIEPHDAGDVARLSGEGHEVIPLRESKEAEDEDELRSIHLSTRHLRHLQQMSYFHHEVDVDSGLTTWLDKPLSNWPVAELSYKMDQEDFAGIITQFGQRPAMLPNWLSELINGMLLSIIVVEDDGALANWSVERSEGDGIPFFSLSDEMGPQPLDPTTSHLVGIALVRGIDPHSQVIELIVPGHVMEVMEEVPCDRIVLAAGCLEVPAWPQAEYLAWAKKNAGDRNVPALEAPWTSGFPGMVKKSTNSELAHGL